jgi:maleylacetate reductase
VPSTYSGSEMTPMWGLSESSRKQTGRDARVVPRLIVYDPALTLTLSPRASAASGFNALAHAVAGMYAEHTSPLVRAIALEAIEQLAAALPAVVRDPADLHAREQALYGAHLAATVLGTAGIGLHHRICHVLGGMYALPHAETHAVVLPYSVAYNEASAAAVNARMASALGGTDAADELWQLARRLGLPASLSELGVPADGIEEVAEAVASTSIANPAKVTREGVDRLLRAAHAGQEPAALRAKQ